MVSPRQPQRDWAALLGFEGAAVQPLSPSPASDELKRRASTAPAHTALNACAKGGSLDAVAMCATLRRRRVPRFRRCRGSMSHWPTATRARRFYCYEPRRGDWASSSNNRSSTPVRQYPSEDGPRPARKWDQLQNTAKVFLDGAFSSLHVKDASQLWASLTTEPELASSALAACCIRGRVALLDDGPSSSPRRLVS